MQKAEDRNDTKAVDALVAKADPLAQQIGPEYLVSVREDIESDESVVIQEWRPDSGGAAADVDDRKSCPL
jgi:hypothetical protein